MNDAFSPHTYQLLYRCRVNFSSSTTFDKNVLNIDRGFKLHLRGVRGGEPGGPRPSPVALATPTARGGGSKGRSYIYLISFDQYRTSVTNGRGVRRVARFVRSSYSKAILSTRLY